MVTEGTLLDYRRSVEKLSRCWGKPTVQADDQVSANFRNCYELFRSMFIEPTRNSAGNLN